MGQAAAGVAKLPPFTARRRPRPIVRKQVRESAQHVGNVLLAWNEAMASLYDVLRWLMADGDFGRARDLWNELKSDDMRRKVIRAAASALDDRKTLQNGLIWSLDQLDALSDIRNHAVHTHLRNWGGELTPDYFTTPDKRLPKPNIEPWMADADAIAGDLRAIADYIYGIAFTIGPQRRVWPLVKRPAVRSSKLVARKSSLKKKGRPPRQRP